MKHRRRMTVLLPLIIVLLDVFATALYQRLLPPSWEATHFVYSVPYAGSPYWSPAFAEEYKQFSRSFALNGGFWTGDFHGRWINHSGLVRRTTDQPQAAPTLWMLGSSTTLNEEVPDEYTTASYLQRDLGGRYRVVNLGSIGATVRLQLLLLRTIPLEPDDAVVFVDGVTDAVNGSPSRKASPLCTTLDAGLLSGLAFIQLACEVTYQTTPFPSPRAEPEAVCGAFLATLTEARAYATLHGASFYHFLEPTIWSRAPSGYEQTLLVNYNLITPEATAYYPLIWPLLQDATRRLPNSYDLTHVRDALRASGVEIYLDYDHATERGNAVLAAAIYDQLTIY